MPIYTYECVKEDGGCGHIFEVFQSMSNYEALKMLKISASQPKCPHCYKNKYVARNFLSDLPRSQVVAQTVGSIAEKNTKSLTKEEKDRLWYENNKYKFAPHEMTLPHGASWTGDIDNRIISTEQKSKPNKKKKDVVKTKRKSSKS